MLITVISIIEWAKLITGLTTASLGFIKMLVMFYEWARLYLTNGTLGSLGWTVFLAQSVLSIIMMIAGFYIAGW
jgi:hypothetical protein